jgi:SAM-dependent methyltransferase
MQMKNALLGLLGRARLLAPAYRAYEAFSSVRGPSYSNAADGLPLPPRRLIFEVTGTADPRWFLESGRLAADSIVDSLARQGRRVAEFRSMLDFGCGCGRVIRRWRGLDRTVLLGTDTNERAVRWCRRNLAFAAFRQNRLEPPLDVADQTIGFAYALSVFTHLPEDLQLRWRDELWRVLEPGAYLLLSTHGTADRARMTQEERRAFDRGELVVRWREVPGLNLCTAFHPERYVRATLAGPFDVVEFVPQGARGNPEQDLVLLRKRER